MERTDAARDDLLLSEPPLRALLGFGAPIALASLLEQLYGVADSMVAGNFVGEDAVAAVGASFALCNVLIYGAIGCGIGAGVLASRLFGEGDRAGAARVAWTSVASFTCVGIALAICGTPPAEAVLGWLGTPPAIMGDSVAYMSVYLAGLPGLFAFNALTAMFNAIGDSRTSLWLIAASAAANVLGDVACVGPLGMGVAGVAISTVVAEYAAAVAGALLLARKTRGWAAAVPGSRDATRPDGVRQGLLDASLLPRIARLAVPSVLQQATIAIGLMLVQAVVNSFGSASLAGFSAAMRVENVATVPTIALGNALSSFASQNLGADGRDRALEGYRVAVRMVAACALAILVVYQLFCKPIVASFLGARATAESLSVGVDYMRFVGWFYALIGLKNVADGMLRGVGDTRVFAVANVINLGMRVGLANWLAPTLGIAVVWWVVPLGWATNFVISHAGVVAWRRGRLASE